MVGAQFKCLLISVCAVLLAGCGAPTAEEIVGRVPVSTVESDTGRLLALINEARKSVGAGALSVDQRLVYAARDHSQSMEKYRYFSHRGRDGLQFYQRMARYSYVRSRSGENIAMARTPETVFRLWYESDGHREIMLEKRHLRVGLYRAGRYWTGVFSAPDGE